MPVANDLIRMGPCHKWLDSIWLCADTCQYSVLVRPGACLQASPAYTIWACVPCCIWYVDGELCLQHRRGSTEYFRGARPEAVSVRAVRLRSGICFIRCYIFGRSMLYRL